MSDQNVPGCEQKELDRVKPIFEKELVEGLVDVEKLESIIRECGIQLSSEVLAKYIDPVKEQKKEDYEKEQQSLKEEAELKEKMEKEEEERKAAEEAASGVKGKKRPSKKPSPRQKKEDDKNKAKGKKGKNQEPEEPEKPTFGVVFDEFAQLYSQIYCAPNFNGNRLRTICRQGNLEEIDELIGRGCNPEGHDGYGCNCIHVVSEYNQVAVLQHLLQAYPRMRINAKDNKGWTGVIYAAAYNQLDILQYLIATLNADINLTDFEKRNALHWASMKGSVEALHFLLKQGMDMECKDINGFTPFLLAVSHDQVETIKALMDHHCDLQATDNYGHDYNYYATSETRDMIEKRIYASGPRRSIMSARRVSKKI